MATPNPTTPATPALLHQNVVPRDALDAAIDGARLSSPVIERPDERAFAFVPDGYKLQDITSPHLLPPRVAERVTVDDRRSLSAYANRFSTPRSILIADYDSLAIAAGLDWHSSNADGEPQPGAVKHIVTLKLRPSEEFLRWDKFEGELHSQAEFAAFLEENVADVCDPAPATLLEIARDLEATQGVTFKSSTRLESGDRAFVYENETRVKGEMKVPREFWLNIPLFNGEEPVMIRAALRFRVQPDGLRLGFEWRRVEYQRQAHFTLMAHTAAEETGLPVYFGRAVR